MWVTNKQFILVGEQNLFNLTDNVTCKLNSLMIFFKRLLFFTLCLSLFTFDGMAQQ